MISFSYNLMIIGMLKAPRLLHQKNVEKTGYQLLNQSNLLIRRPNAIIEACNSRVIFIYFAVINKLN